MLRAPQRAWSPRVGCFPQVPQYAKVSKTPSVLSPTAKAATGPGPRDTATPQASQPDNTELSPGMAEAFLLALGPTLPGRKHRLPDIKAKRVSQRRRPGAWEPTSITSHLLFFKPGQAPLKERGRRLLHRAAGHGASAHGSPRSHKRGALLPTFPRWLRNVPRRPTLETCLCSIYTEPSAKQRLRTGNDALFNGRNIEVLNIN